LFITTLLSGITARLDARGRAVWLGRADVAPGDIVLALVRGDSRCSLGADPDGRKNARGRPVMETLTNVRSETLFAKTAFDGLSGSQNRCALRGIDLFKPVKQSHNLFEVSGFRSLSDPVSSNFRCRE
jgi:hypothetical protein